MSGTDHWVGINHVCPDCGAKWGGSIPKGHYLGCPQGRQPLTQEQIDQQNAEAAKVREANRLQAERFRCDRQFGPDHDHDRLACDTALEEIRQGIMRENARATTT